MPQDLTYRFIFNPFSFWFYTRPSSRHACTSSPSASFKNFLLRTVFHPLLYAVVFYFLFSILPCYIWSFFLESRRCKTVISIWYWCYAVIRVIRVSTTGKSVDTATVSNVFREHGYSFTVWPSHDICVLWGPLRRCICLLPSVKCCITRSMSDISRTVKLLN